MQVWMQDVAHIINLRGEYKAFEIGNALLHSSSVQPKTIAFSVSSSSHPEKIAIDNAFVIPNLKV